MDVDEREEKRERIRTDSLGGDDGLTKTLEQGRAFLQDVQSSRAKSVLW